MVSSSMLWAISMAWSDRVFRPWAVMSMSMEGKRSARAETTTLSTMTMATNTTVIKVAMPPRLNLLERKGFFPFLGAGFLAPFCFTSVCLVSIVRFPP